MVASSCEISRRMMQRLGRERQRENELRGQHRKRRKIKKQGECERRGGRMVAKREAEAGAEAEAEAEAARKDSKVRIDQ